MERSSQTVRHAMLAVADCIADKQGRLGFYRSLTIAWPQHAWFDVGADEYLTQNVFETSRPPPPPASNICTVPITL